MKSLIFNTLLQRVMAVVFTLTLLIIAACGEDEDPASISTVQFANGDQTASENGTAITVSISFDKAADKDGTITVTLTEGADTDYTTHYTTNPNGSSGSIELQVSKGQTSTQFTLTPVNNALLADDKTIELSISDVSSGFEIGTLDSKTITIIDDEGPTQVNFATATSSTAENLTDGIDVTINLSSAAPGTGTITVAFTSTTATYTTDFTTEPTATDGEFQVPVAQGATTVTFKVKPVDDGAVNAAHTIIFTLDEASGAVALGTAITTHTFTITDNETPSVVAFDEESSSVDESDAEGITIPLTLTPQTNGTGTIVVTFAGGTYGTDFTTDPEAVSGEITVPVASDATTASFKVIPTNNDNTNAGPEITFTLSEVTGIVTLGTTGLTHEVIIQDDDAITTIADVRAMYTASNITIAAGTRIKGVVVSNNNNLTSRNIFIQDETGSIALKFASANTFAQGDELLINVGGITLTRTVQSSSTDANLGPLLIGLYNASVPNANASKTGTGTVPAATDITLTQLNSGEYEGKLVSVASVYFPDADGIVKLQGSKNITDGSVTGVVRTESYTSATWKDTPMPLGSGTIKGIASTYNEVEQIIPMQSSDIFESNPVGTIDITGTLADFGSVNNGQESVSQSYTVNGATLTQSITVTASANYLVSSNNIDFTATASLPSTGGTVYVKFAPTSGADQAIAGTITHKSQGAVSVVVNVTGTEAGNGASALQTLALWTFETSIPTTAGPHNAEGGILAGSTAQALGFHVSSSTAYSNPAGNGTSESFSSNYWDTNDYYQFSLNSTGYSDINISWDQTRSGSGPSAFALYYSTDGTNFTKHADYTVVEATGGWSSGTPKTGTSYTYDLSAITGLNDAATLVFRLVHTGSGISTNGTNRVDSVKIEGR